MINYFNFHPVCRDDVYSVFANFTPCFKARLCFFIKVKI